MHQSQAPSLFSVEEAEGDGAGPGRGQGYSAIGGHLGKTARSLEQLPPVLWVTDADFPQILLFHHVRPLRAERRMLGPFQN